VASERVIERASGQMMPVGVRGPEVLSAPLEAGAAGKHESQQDGQSVEMLVT
jgi:hypothetical protein